MPDPAPVPARRAATAALASVAAGAALAAAASLLLPVDLNYRVSGVFDQTVRTLTRTAGGFLAGALLGPALVWLVARPRSEHDFRPGLVGIGAATGALFGSVASSLLTAVVVGPLAARAGTPGSPEFTRVFDAARWALLLPPLLLAALGALRGARLSRPLPAALAERLARAFVPPAAVAVALALAARGSGFPAAAPPETRDAWARGTFPGHYPAAAELARTSPSISSDVGAVRSVAPAPGADNRVFYGATESTAVFTLDVGGERGEGRLRVEMTAPFAPAAALPRFVSVVWERNGKTTPLDATGNALAPP